MVDVGAKYLILPRGTSITENIMGLQDPIPLVWEVIIIIIMMIITVNIY